MSGDSSEEKALPATAKKLRDARGKGQIAQSADFVSAAALCAAIAYLWSRSGMIADQWREALTLATQIHGEPFDLALRQLLSALGSATGRTLVPLLAVTVAAGVLASVLVNRGFVFSLAPMIPKLENLNPFTCLKRIFGLKNWVELAKTLAKAALLGAALFFVVLGSLDTLVRLPVCGPNCIGYVFGSMAKYLLAIAAGFFLAAGLVDLLLQRWLFLREMRMSQTEAKREHQEQEGNPLVKTAHRRHRHAAADEPRLGVARATVVITGGGYAVGLRYVEGETRAPIVVCRGKADAAIAIVAGARQHGVTLVEEPGLARVLTRKAKLAGAVPSQYFQQVAKAFYAAGMAS